MALLVTNFMTLAKALTFPSLNFLICQMDVVLGFLLGLSGGINEMVHVKKALSSTCESSQNTVAAAFNTPPPPPPNIYSFAESRSQGIYDLTPSWPEPVSRICRF